MQQLGKNHGGYFGETIDIATVLRDCVAAARSHHWSVEAIPAELGLDLWAFTRPATSSGVTPATFRAYLSTGIHGDEPAGPLAALQLLRDNVWPAHAELCLLPCLNPTGLRLNRRDNARGKDLNRDYRHLETSEIRAQVRWLERQPPFDVTFCLHEDWESHGFYLYELNPERRRSLAPIIIEAVTPVCPIDLSPVIEEREASGGIISPNLDPNSRPQWPEAFWLVQNKTRQSYTFEAPSDFPLPTRVAALVAGVRAALAAL